MKLLSVNPLPNGEVALCLEVDGSTHTLFLGRREQDDIVLASTAASQWQDEQRIAATSMGDLLRLTLVALGH